MGKSKKNSKEPTYKLDGSAIIDSFRVIVSNNLPTYDSRSEFMRWAQEQTQLGNLLVWIDGCNICDNGYSNYVIRAGSQGIFQVLGWARDEDDEDNESVFRTNYTSLGEYLKYLANFSKGSSSKLKSTENDSYWTYYSLNLSRPLWEPEDGEDDFDDIDQNDFRYGNGAFVSINPEIILDLIEENNQ